MMTRPTQFNSLLARPLGGSFGAVVVAAALAAALCFSQSVGLGAAPPDDRPTDDRPTDAPAATRPTAESASSEQPAPPHRAPGRANKNRADDASADSGRANAGRADTGRADTGRADARRSGIGRPDAARGAGPGAAADPKNDGHGERRPADARPDAARPDDAHPDAARPDDTRPGTARAPDEGPADDAPPRDRGDRSGPWRPQAGEGRRFRTPPPPTDEQWRQVWSFLQDNQLPNRQAWYDLQAQQLASDPAALNELRARMSLRVRGLRRLQENNPDLYDFFLRQMRNEDTILGLVMQSNAEPADEAVETKLRDEVRTRVESFLAERQRRLNELQKRLADEQTELSADRERLDTLVDQQVERFKKDPGKIGWMDRREDRDAGPPKDGPPRDGLSPDAPPDRNPPPRDPPKSGPKDDKPASGKSADANPSTDVSPKDAQLKDDN